MVDKMKDMLGKLGMTAVLIAFIATPVIAITVASEGASQANEKADKALQMAEKTRSEFDYFKGSVSSKLDTIMRDNERIIEFISNIERVPDHG